MDDSYINEDFCDEMMDGMMDMSTCPMMMYGSGCSMMPTWITYDEDLLDDAKRVEENEERVTPQEVDRIVRKIEKNNPNIYRTLRMYGVPYAVAGNLVRRIVRLTLMYQ